MNITPTVIAAFDFDGTLTYKDTLIPFLFHCLGTPKALMTLAPSIPHVAAFYCGLKSRQHVKEALLMRAFKNWNLSSVNNAGASFANQKINKLLNPVAMEKFRWHKSQNHYCVLISANLSCYLQTFAKNNGFDLLISSSLATPSQKHPLGMLSGENCWGPEKVRRLQLALGEKNYILYAYGDSQGDHALLSYADHAFYRKFN